MLRPAPDRPRHTAPPAASHPAVLVRPLRTHDELVRCVDLQNAVWGADFSERVPSALLMVALRIGGIAAGAFDEQDRLAGFVFGITGVEGGRLVHWSDMLAVRPDMRDNGIGRRLKEYQRDTLRRRGVTRIYWTYDPLVSRNAHLNLNRLGARVVDYVPDMYGSDTSSVLHRGLGTDRFVVLWDVEREGPAVPPAAPDVSAPNAPVLNPLDAGGLPTVPDLAGRARDAAVRIAIPLAIDRVQEGSVAAAARWRTSTRCAILWAIDAGYRVTGFTHDPDARCAYYVCSAPPPNPLA